jgi:hypothetical protein
MIGNPQQTLHTWASIFDHFFQFLEWLYDGVNFPPQLRQPIETEIQRGLAQNDPTVQELFDYLTQVQGYVFSPLGPGQNAARHQLREFFRTRYQINERSGRGRILAAVHLAVEQLRPGATRLPLAVPVSPAGPSQPALQQMVLQALQQLLQGGAPPGVPPPVQGYPQPGPFPGGGNAGGAGVVIDEYQLKKQIDNRNRMMEIQLYRDRKEDDLLRSMWR